MNDNDNTNIYNFNNININNMYLELGRLLTNCNPLLITNFMTKLVT